MHLLIVAARAAFVALAVLSGVVLLFMAVNLPGAGDGPLAGLAFLAIGIFGIGAALGALAAWAGYHSLRHAGTQPPAAERSLRIAATVASVVLVPEVAVLLFEPLGFVGPVVAMIAVFGFAVVAVASPRRWAALLAGGMLVAVAIGTTLTLPGQLAERQAAQSGDELRELRMRAVSLTDAGAVAASLRASNLHPFAIAGVADYLGPNQQRPWPVWGIDQYLVTPDAAASVAVLGAQRVRFFVATQCVGASFGSFTPFTLGTGAELGAERTIGFEDLSTVSCDGKAHVLAFTPVDLPDGVAAGAYADLRFDPMDEWAEGRAWAFRWVLIVSDAAVVMDQAALGDVVTSALGGDLPT